MSPGSWVSAVEMEGHNGVHSECTVNEPKEKISNTLGRAIHYTSWYAL